MPQIPRTSLHGTDESGLSTIRAAHALTGVGGVAANNMGARFWDEDLFGMRVKDTTMGQWIPVAGYIPFKFDPSGNTAQRAIGDHILDGVTVPRGFVVTRVWYDVVTTFTSAGDLARIGIMAQAAGDLATPLRINNPGNPWDSGVHAGVPADTAATAVKITQNRTVEVRVETEALTAGLLYGVLEGFMSESATAEEESSSSGSSSSSSSSSSNSSSSSCSESSSSSSSCSNSSSSCSNSSSSLSSSSSSVNSSSSCSSLSSSSCSNSSSSSSCSANSSSSSSSSSSCSAV